MDLRSKSKRQRLTQPNTESSESHEDNLLKSNQRKKNSVAKKAEEKSKLSQGGGGEEDEESVPIDMEVSPSTAKDLTLTRVTELMETWSSLKCRQPQHSHFFNQLSQIMRGYGNYMKDIGSQKQTQQRGEGMASTSQQQQQHRMVTIVNRSTLRFKLFDLPPEPDRRLLKVKKGLKRLQSSFMSSSPGTSSSSSFGKQFTTKQKRKELEKKIKSEKEKQEADRKNVEMVMSNHLTAQVIFQYLSVKDLMSCSRVSTSWLRNAREVLRRDKKCFAKIDFRNTCRRLRALKVLIETSTNLPFNGISVDYSCYSCRNYRNAPPLNSQLNSALVLDPQKITVKYLKIANWRVNSHCPIFYLIRTIFVHHCASLQEITVRLITSENYQPISGLGGLFASPNGGDTATVPIVVNPNLLPKLKEITLPDGQLTAFSTVINDIILCSPNLERIINKVYLNTISPLVVNRKAHVVKKMCFMPLRADDLQLSCDFAAQPLQVKELCMSSGAAFNFASFRAVYAVLRMLYSSCQETLQHLDLTQVDLLMLAGPTIPILSGVRQLHLHYNLRLDTLLGYPSLTKIQYDTKLPNLQSLVVDRLDPMSLIHGARQWPAEFRTWWANSPEFSCLSVSRVKFELQPSLGTFGEDHLVERRMIESFPTVFNHVAHLHLHRATDFPHIFTHLWTAWSTLETLTLTGIEDNDLWRNFDSTFTGISEENCNRMRETKNYENFREMQVQPSITNLRGLKLLRLHIHHQHIKCEDDEDVNRNILLTQVTGHCCFATMSDLKIEISRDSCQYKLRDRKCSLTLDCLMPFAKFTSYTYDVPKGWELAMDNEP